MGTDLVKTGSIICILGVAGLGVAALAIAAAGDDVPGALRGLAGLSVAVAFIGFFVATWGRMNAKQ